MFYNKAFPWPIKSGPEILNPSLLQTLYTVMIRGKICSERLPNCSLTFQQKIVPHNMQFKISALNKMF